MPGGGLLDIKPGSSSNMIAKYITPLNMLLIAGTVLIIYIFYKWWISGWPDNQSEGFQDNNIKALTDLLDKQKVNLYELTPIWDNILYNAQPQRKERPMSVWKPSKEAGELYKEIGHCVSDNAEYNSPAKTTMLVKGDTKPPVDSKLIFSFPDNIITASMFDSAGNKVTSIYAGIRSMRDIDDRITSLNKHLEEVQTDYDNVKAELDNKLAQLDTRGLVQRVEVSSKNNYFMNPAQIYDIRPGETINITPGEYSTIRIPFGSKVSLTSSTGRTLEFELPYNALLNESRTDIINNGRGPGYLDVIKRISGETFTADDFNLAGRYAFKARDLMQNINDADNSTDSRNWSQNNTQVYMPYSRDYEYGLFNDKVPVRNSYNYAVGGIGHDMYGRDQIFAYYMEKLKMSVNNTATGGTDTSVDIRTGSDMLNFSVKKDLYIDKRDDARDRTPNKVKLYNSMITNKPAKLEVNYSGITSFFNKLKSMKSSASSWYMTDSAMLDNPELATIIASPYDQLESFSLDLAFMLTTYIRKLVMDDTPGFTSYAKNVNGNDCCEISTRSVTEESLSRTSNFQGYLTKGTVTLQTTPDQYISYGRVKAKLEKVASMTTSALNNISKMINMLEALKRDISENKFAHFPLKIYRPIAPPDYTNLGDVLFVVDDANYHKRTPILDTFACVPSQCTREIREWLPADKIYEYSQGDVYLAIYRNPYLQTFRASTTPGVLPPGKVVKVVACVEKCRLLDDIIEADKCAKTFYSANKAVLEGNNLDKEKQVLDRESLLYKNEISSREDKLNTMRELTRRLQIQDDKADIINKEHNRQQLQSLVDTQRVNMNKLVDNLDAGKHAVDINIKFDYDKFAGLITRLKPKLPPAIYNKITMAVSNSAKKKLDAIPDETVSEVLGYCPSPETQGLVVKALVESGCYNCANLN